MKKVISLMAVVAFLFSVDATAGEPKNKGKKKKAQTEQKAEEKKSCSAEEKKSCDTGSEKKSCCASKSKESKS